MKFLLPIIALILFSQTSLALDEEIYGSYVGKYAKNANGNLQPRDFEVAFVKGKFYFTKGDNTKTYHTVDKGTFIDNDGVKYHKFYLINKDIFVLVSYDTTEVFEDIEYQTLIINGAKFLIKQ